MNIEEMKEKINVPSNKRYVLQLGRFGMYVFDTVKQQDVDLQQIIDKLNEIDECKKEVKNYAKTIGKNK